MQEGIPDNMPAVQARIAELQQQGETVDEAEFIYQTIQDLLQDYLDNAEEGHYDSIKPVDQQTMAFIDITGKNLGEFKSDSDSLVNDFKTNDLKMTLAMEQMADKIAKDNP